MQFQRSTRKDKKYMVKIHGKTIHFGAKSYQQYKDSTGLGLYSHLDHGDSKRRKAYFMRHSGVPTKGEAVQKELGKSGGKYNAKILSHMYLW